MKVIPLYFHLLVGFFFCSTLFAQETILEKYTPIDSLVGKDYKTLRNYFIKKLPFNDIEPDSLLAHHIAMAYLWKGQQNQDSLRMGIGYCLLGQLENFRIDYFDKSILYTENNKNDQYPGLAYAFKYVYYYYNGNNKEAVNMLLKAIEHAKNVKNLRLIYDYQFNINTLNSQWGDKVLSIKEFKKYLAFLDSSKFDSIYPKYTLKKKEIESISIHYNIAKTHYGLKMYSDASEHLNIIYDYSRKSSEAEFKSKYLGLKSAIYFRQKKYKEALQLTNEYFTYIASDDLYGLSSSYNIKGLTLWGLGRKNEAIQAIQKADSIYQISEDIFEELGEGYQLLINYYKEIGDTENQLRYLNKLIIFDREISSNYIEIGNRIAQEYTIPELLSEKEEAIQKLNTENTSQKRTKGLFLSLLVLVSLVTTFFIYRSYRNKKKFTALIHQFETTTDQKVVSAIPETAVKKHEPQELEEKQRLLISKGLEHFEVSKGYLDADVTLQSLAKSIATNSSYLSKYINTVKESNFSKYINTLRVQYAIYKLQSDPKFRAYTIEGMASEVGFSNMRSFTNYFKKETGLTVSYFVKNIKKSSASTT